MKVDIYTNKKDSNKENGTEYVFVPAKANVNNVIPSETLKDYSLVIFKTNSEIDPTANNTISANPKDIIKQINDKGFATTRAKVEVGLSFNIPPDLKEKIKGKKRN